jgi:hypothetical protein
MGSFPPAIYRVFRLWQLFLIIFNDNGKCRARFFRVTAPDCQPFRHFLQFNGSDPAVHYKYFRTDFRAHLVPDAALFVNLHFHVMLFIFNDRVIAAAVNHQE